MMRIVIVDDHPLVRQGIIALLSLEEEVEVVGEAATCSEAVQLIQKQQPDLAVVDLRLGDGAEGSGLDVVKSCREQGPDCKFIILTSSVSTIDFQKACAVGIEGYLLKEAFPEELLMAIKLVGKGRKCFDPNLMETVMCKKDNSWEKLTAKEQEVLLLLAEGLTNREIAEKLYISESTVKKHVSQVLAKLELGDRTKAAVYAYGQGLIGNN
ncbi:MAG: response regulator transcription factor [Desulfitobacteriaceae bacterium]|jgi:two-component system nitrate/nitrite response regulator NarL|nr:response regulator transcription factor [Desulfitobacteriaceae bacterium]